MNPCRPGLRRRPTSPLAIALGPRFHEGFPKLEGPGVRLVFQNPANSHSCWHSPAARPARKLQWRFLRPHVAENAAKSAEFPELVEDKLNHFANANIRCLGPR